MTAHAGGLAPGPITSRSAAWGSLVKVRASGRASRRGCRRGLRTIRPRYLRWRGRICRVIAKPAWGPAEARWALSWPAGCRYRAVSQAGGGQPGRLVQRREPVTNTRAPEGGVSSASTASSEHHPSRRGCRDRAHAPKAQSATGQCDRPSATRRSRPTSRGGRSRTSRPAGRPPAASGRRWRDDQWPANTGRPGRSRSTPETIAPAARSARCRRLRRECGYRAAHRLWAGEHTEELGECSTMSTKHAIDDLHLTERVAQRESTARIHELMGELRRCVLDDRDLPFRDVAGG